MNAVTLIFFSILFWYSFVGFIMFQEEIKEWIKEKQKQKKL
jgi:hypothetical protein